MLAMLLIYAPDKYEILFASAHASDIFRKKVSSLTSGQPVSNVYGTSFWMVAR